MLVNTSQSRMERASFNAEVVFAGVGASNEGSLQGTASSYSLASPSFVSADRGMRGLMLLAKKTSDDEAAERAAEKAEEAVEKLEKALEKAEAKSAAAADKVEKAEKIAEVSEAIADAVVETIHELVPKFTVRVGNVEVEVDNTKK